MKASAVTPLVFASVTLLDCSAFAPNRSRNFGPSQSLINMKAATSSSSTNEIEVVSQPDKDFLESKGAFSWGTWGCNVSKFPWTYDSSESCYLLEGQVTVTPADGREAATFGKGDFVTFPAGMSCEWDVSQPVQKHFMFF